MRWIASMVAEAHRILMRGGVFLYPRDTKDPSKPGRLRLLYEANPIGFIIEQAGGRASTGPPADARRAAERAAPAHRRWSSARATRSSASSATTTSPRDARRRHPAVRRAQPVPRLSDQQFDEGASHVSERHPIIAITGSSGAGTTSVTRTFENIFRRENVKAAVIEGDSFHRYDRKEMKLRQAEAEERRQQALQPLRPGEQPVRRARAAVPQLRRKRHRPAPQVPARRRRGRALQAGARHLHALGGPARRHRPAVLRRPARRGGHARGRTSRATPTC